ncbi:hypothetical protein [Marinactinospora rubrisoli]|uniref:DUF4190 domain-containing protein n=1 Tax=Marinactinospora rubrisoli TaxID=2715399 RepID=A0ABW2KAY5_9ACTN
MSNHWPGPSDYWSGSGRQPDGHPGYGNEWQHPPGGYPPVPPPYGPPPSRGSTITAMVVAIITTVACCTTNILGIIFAAMALGERDPERAEQLTRWAWTSNIVHVALLVLLISALIVMGVAGEL